MDNLTLFQLYWINRMDNLHITCIILIPFCITIYYLSFLYQEMRDKEDNTDLRILRIIMVIVFVLSILFKIFAPTSKELEILWIS